MNPTTIAKLNALALCQEEVERLFKMLAQLDKNFFTVFYREWAVYVFFKNTKLGLYVTCPTDKNMDSWRYGFVITTTFITQNGVVVPIKLGRRFGYENAREWHNIDELVDECNRLLSLVPLV